ncbi:MAG TPA: guanine deaminase [Steroidobacteraceae bacterium]|nr:guanine deaminase [Steroidobacteraceae bacterium]
MQSLQAWRGSLLRFSADPGSGDSGHEYFTDGLLLIEAGRIAGAGPAESLLRDLPRDLPVTDCSGKLILPGFVDNHIHFPQIDVIGSGGRELLDWLETHTFPAERRYADTAYAAAAAEDFLDELLRNGTTTAMVYCTMHVGATNAFFAAARARGLRMIAGKVLMDRNCPEYLRDPPGGGLTETRELIARWHGVDRLGYAVTPRFAASSTEAQLAGAGLIAREHADVFIQTHLAENHAEIAWTRQLYPAARSYLDIYERFGLLRERAIFAHCIHMDHADRQHMAHAGAAAAFCPTSNLSLGSGLFDIAATDAAGLRFSIATDVGGGTSFSQFRSMDEASKVAMLKGQYLSPLRAFYLSTLGAARALGLEDRIGSLATGTEADFIVVDPDAIPLLARRRAQSTSLTELLRLLITLGDERVIHATCSLGVPQRYRAAERTPNTAK